MNTDKERGDFMKKMFRILGGICFFVFCMILSTEPLEWSVIGIVALFGALSVLLAYKGGVFAEEDGDCSNECFTDIDSDGDND